MSTIAVEKVIGDGRETPSLMGKLESMTERIRQRAFEIFAARGSDGREIEDWLQAERELFLAPESEVSEKDGEYELRVAVPGFKPAETSVTAFPDALIISAESTHQNDDNSANGHSPELQKSLYRRLELPTPIRVDQVVASLDDGILRNTVQKAERVEPAMATA
jgi:HSP20 family molecular chaperone IbpA